MTRTWIEAEPQLEVERPGRLGPWLGIAFVVLFVGGFLLFQTPDSNASQAKWDAWWLSSSHRETTLVATYLMVLGTLGFVGFMWNLALRFRPRAGAPTTFGALFVALAIVSALMRAAIPGGKQFGGLTVPTGGWAAQFDNIGIALLLVGGAISAGAFLVTASFWAHRYNVLPSWLTMSGYVVGVLQLGAAMFLPFVLFPIWVLVTSIVLMTRDSRERDADPRD